jgi:hypothetical protein
MKTTEVHTWAQNKPAVLSLMHSLNEAYIDWALFSGTVARPKTSDDVDILVSSTGFDEMRALVPKHTIHLNKLMHVTCGDGVRLRMLTDEIVYPLDNTEIQVMRPAPVLGSHGHRYLLSLTPEAGNARTQHQVDGVIIHEANAFDTMLIKSIMQRDHTQRKCDSADLAAIAAEYDWNEVYITRRVGESNYDYRADTFLQRYTGYSALRSDASMLAVA